VSEGKKGGRVHISQSTTTKFFVLNWLKSSARVVFETLIYVVSMFVVSVPVVSCLTFKTGCTKKPHKVQGKLKLLKGNQNMTEGKTDGQG
jgi:hypothetical protein